MTRWLAIIAALLAGTACAVAQGQYLDPDCPTGNCPQSLPLAPVHREQPAKLQQDLWAAVARIKTDDGSMGSGVLVAVNDSGGLVLTNNHVVKDARSPSGIVVSFPGGFSSGGRVERVDATWDLAAIHISRPPAKPVTLASTNIPVRGELLAIAGFGDPSSRGRAVAGRCTGYFAPRVGMQGDWFEVNAVARSGDSGGPVFNERGQLAGVLWGSDFQTGTQGICCGRIRSFLRGLIGLTPKQPTPNVPIVPAPPSTEIAIGEPTTPAPSTTPAVPAGPGAQNGGTSEAPLFNPNAPTTAPPVVSGPPAIPQPVQSGIESVVGGLAAAGATALGLSGPAGMIASLAACWMVRRIGKRIDEKLSQPRGGETSAGGITQVIRTITEPATPQPLAIDERHHNHFVEVPDSREAKAWAHATRVWGDRFPGAQNTLKGIERLKDQILSGQPTSIPT